MKEAIRIISNEDIKNIAKQLKELDTNWAPRLHKNMESKGVEFELSQIYNLVSGGLKNQKYRRIFVVHAIGLLTDLEKEQEEGISLIEKKNRGDQHLLLSE